MCRRVEMHQPRKSLLFREMHLFVQRSLNGRSELSPLISLPTARKSEEGKFSIVLNIEKALRAEGKKKSFTNLFRWEK